MQVSVLTDQVEAQGEKIRDLDLCLDEHREKLNATEEMLQQVRVCVIWHKAEDKLFAVKIKLHLGAKAACVKGTLTRSSDFMSFYQKALLCSMDASLPFCCCIKFTRILSSRGSSMWCCHVWRFSFKPLSQSSEPFFYIYIFFQIILLIGQTTQLHTVLTCELCQL